MNAKRQYEPYMILGARVYGMKNLWEPSREYKGQPTQRPNYIAGFIVPKTQGHWSQEPVFANVFAAMQKIYNATMPGTPYDHVEWPIKDGDVPSEPGRAIAEWAKGHWMFGGSSGDPIKVEMTQGNNLVPLQARANLVKPGDFVIVGGATAQKANNPRGIKLYINNVVFTQAGEEIAVGNSVSGAELMQAAAAQGYRPTGFQPSAGGFGGGAPSGGGFSLGTASGFAQTPGAPANQGFANPPNGNAAPGSAFPSNPPAGGGFPGAGAPGGFPTR